jgi:hypothetical protein
MTFDPVFRTLFQGTAGSSNINGQVLTEIQGIEAEAKKIRLAGGSPEAELRDRISKLKSDVGMATFETVGALDGELDVFKQEWTAARDRAPDRELALIRRSENEFKGLSDKQVSEMAMAYMEGTRDLIPVELNEVVGRLRQSGDYEAELEALQEAIPSMHGLSPWLKDEAAAKLLDYRDKLQQLEPGEVHFEHPDHGSASFDLDSLIDLSGELEQPATVE